MNGSRKARHGTAFGKMVELTCKTGEVDDGRLACRSARSTIVAEIRGDAGTQDPGSVVIETRAYPLCVHDDRGALHPGKSRAESHSRVRARPIRARAQYVLQPLQ